jgi:hypothetical protein
VYQIKSDPYKPNSVEQILLKAKVRLSSDFPPSADPPEVDFETARLAVNFYEESMQPNYEFTTSIPEDDSGPQIVSSAKPMAYGKQTDIISFMVLWSKKSECTYSGLPEGCIVTEETEDNMRALIDASVAETNTVFTLSKIDIQLELVHAYRHPTYTEEEAEDTDFLGLGLWENTLGRMLTPIDGMLDDLQWKRKRYKADMVSLVIDAPPSCGMAYVGTGYSPAPSAPFMHSLVALDCAIGG